MIFLCLIFYQITVNTNINNAIVINTNASKSYDPIISSQIIAESSIVVVKYFPFSQLHVEGLQTQSF